MAKSCIDPNPRMPCINQPLQRHQFLLLAQLIECEINHANIATQPPIPTIFLHTLSSVFLC